MKQKGTRPRREQTRGRRTAVVWVLLAAITAAALTTGACALWLPDRAPTMLGMPHTVESAPASSQEYSGTQQVNVVPTVAADRQLLGNATGTVTQNWTGGELRSGSRAYQVNDRTVVVLHTATPLYRDLKVGDRGEDVRSLNDELSRLRYDSVPQSSEYNWNTGNGWRQLMVDAGNSDGAGEDDMNLRLSDTMWIPSDSVKVQGWSATQGSAMQAGAPLGTVPGGLVRLAIRGGKPSDEERTLTVFGVAAPLAPGSIDITNGELLQRIAATEGYQGKSAEERAAGMDAQLTLNKTIQALRVPAGSVFGINGTSACIAIGTFDNPHVVPVRIITSELGASLVQPPSGGGTGSGQAGVTSLNKGFDSHYDPYATYMGRMTHWIPYLSILIGVAIGALAVRVRRLEYAAALHSGESKPAQLLGICTEVLVWAGLGALSACALICAYCARMAIGDVASVMLASCRAPLAMCSGTFVGAIAMGMTVRQSQLFRLFKRR